MRTVEIEAALQELDELRRLGIIGQSLCDKARAVVRDEGGSWQAMSTSEMADMALDLARIRR